jgi:hypothetical protein
VDVSVLNDDVAQVDPYAEYNPLFLGNAGIACGHPALDRDRTGDGLYDARKLDQEAIPGCLYDPALVLGELGIDQFAAMGSEPGESSGLVLAHEAAISGHIGGENGRKTALYPLPAHDAFSLNAIRFEFSIRQVV